MNRLVFVLAIFCVVSFSGCHEMRLASQAPFDVAARNAGNLRLANVSVEFEGFRHSFGLLLPPGAGGGRYSLFEGRWPEVATIKWRIDGERPYMPDHEATVAVPPRPKLEGPDEEVTLWFDLDGEGVTVRLETYDYGWIREYRRTGKIRKSAPEN